MAERGRDAQIIDCVGGIFTGFILPNEHGMRIIPARNSRTHQRMWITTTTGIVMRPGQHLYHFPPINTRLKGLTVPETEYLIEIYKEVGDEKFTRNLFNPPIHPSFLKKLHYSGYIMKKGKIKDVNTWKIRGEQIMRIKKTIGATT